MTLSILRSLSFTGMALVAALLLAVPAVADSLALKQSGAAIEQTDGYLGGVAGTRAPDAADQIAEINAARRAAYQSVADKTGATLAEVETAAAARIGTVSGDGPVVVTAAELRQAARADINRALDEIIAGNPDLFN